MTKQAPKPLAGILFVTGICVVLTAAATWYKYDDEYCRYNAEIRPVSEVHPACRDQAIEAERVRAEQAEQ